MTLQVAIFLSPELRLQLQPSPIRRSDCSLYVAGEVKTRPKIIASQQLDVTSKASTFTVSVLYSERKLLNSSELAIPQIRINISHQTKEDKSRGRI